MQEQTQDETTQPPPNPRGQMLPGIAAIALFMMFMTLVNVYAALKGAYGQGLPKYGILALCTLLAVGVLGLLRLRKWGWALVSAAALLFGSGYLYYFSKTHIGFFLIQGLFALIFFFYLVRQETRERLS
jgi:hypothetical protein